MDVLQLYSDYFLFFVNCIELNEVKCPIYLFRFADTEIIEEISITGSQPRVSHS